GLKYVVKIGGCDALTDIYQAKKYGADSIISPMIESKYAVQKFVDNCKKIYSDLEQVNLSINIESINAYDNLGSILTCEDMKSINGIVLGRDDMAKSLSLSIDDVNSDKIFNIAVDISNKALEYGKSFTIGGGIRPQAINFVKAFNGQHVTSYETRRIVFDFYMLNKNYTVGVTKAIEFEIKWLEYLVSNRLADNLALSRIENLKNSLYSKL
ncbi:MAG: aldolase/citrate lyase family protein, partial [Candidatus Gastranaerophilaceae bacterium]|nr:aldolase/citrate lyase family protein [Candidatus Gastranaerophilaceae bacterium]